MDKRKPRTKPQTRNNCDHDECHNPWAHLCGGDRHKCGHLRMKYLASLSDKERERVIKKYHI